MGTSVGKNPQTYSAINGRFTQLIQLFAATKFADTTNPGGEYKVWISQNPQFPSNESKTDNYKVKSANISILLPQTLKPTDNKIVAGDDLDGESAELNKENIGEVTPPPSESVSPPLVRITPDRVPAGDPTITLKSFEIFKAVYALLPDGRKLDLHFNNQYGLWIGSFLVPFGTSDGPYRIQICTVNLDNVTQKYIYTIIIDNSCFSLGFHSNSWCSYRFNSKNEKIKMSKRMGESPVLFYLINVL